MCVSVFKDVSAGLQSLATVGALIGGGLWAYHRYRLFRESAPCMEFSVDLRFVGCTKGDWVVEVIANLENKGKVRHDISTWTFDLLGLKAEDPFVEGGEDIGRRLKFPYEVKKGSWIGPKWEYTFVEPGVKTTYSFVTTVPCIYEYVLLHGRFGYKSPMDQFHTADKVFLVPKVGELPPADSGD